MAIRIQEHILSKLQINEIYNGICGGAGCKKATPQMAFVFIYGCSLNLMVQPSEPKRALYQDPSAGLHKLITLELRQ